MVWVIGIARCSESRFTAERVRTPLWVFVVISGLCCSSRKARGGRPIGKVCPVFLQVRSSNPNVFEFDDFFNGFAASWWSQSVDGVVVKEDRTVSKKDSERVPAMSRRSDARCSTQESPSMVSEPISSDLHPKSDL